MTNSSNKQLKIKGIGSNLENDNLRIPNLPSLQNIDSLKINDISLSPTKIHQADLISRGGYNSEVGTPTNLRKPKTNNSMV